jgi:hypothetical protein
MKMALHCSGMLSCVGASLDTPTDEVWVLKNCQVLENSRAVFFGFLVVSLQFRSCGICTVLTSQVWNRTRSVEEWSVTVADSSLC